MSLCCGRIIGKGPGRLTKLSEEFSHDCRCRGPGLNSFTPSPVRCLCFPLRDGLLRYSFSEHLECVMLFPVSCLSDDKSRPVWGHLPARFGREHKAGLRSGLLASTCSDIRTITQAGGRCLSHRGVVQMTTRPSRTTAVSCSVITGSPVSA